MHTNGSCGCDIKRSSWSAWSAWSTGFSCTKAKHLQAVRNHHRIPCSYWRLPKMTRVRPCGVQQMVFADILGVTGLHGQGASGSPRNLFVHKRSGQSLRLFGTQTTVLEAVWAWFISRIIRVRVARGSERRWVCPRPPSTPHSRRRSRWGNHRGHAMVIVDDPAVGVNPCVAGSSDPTVPISGGSWVYADLRGHFATCGTALT